MTPKKQRPPRFAPFKVGDRVVLCPHRIASGQRGQTGTIIEVEGHLAVWVSLVSRISLTPCPVNINRAPFSFKIPTYDLRHASECHSCINRMSHMVGGFCPSSWKEIVFYEKSEGEVL